MLYKLNIIEKHQNMTSPEMLQNMNLNINKINENKIFYISSSAKTKLINGCG